MRTDCYAPLAVTREAVVSVASAYFGNRGLFAYQAFDWINRELFASELPTPLILWSLTPHGGCLGLTAVSSSPVITLHPSLLGGTERANPWGFEPTTLGWALAFDVLIHECIHVSVMSRLAYRRKKSETSHNNPAWLAEVARIAPKIGLPGLVADRSRTKRVRDAEGGSRVVRVCESNVPYRALATFPHAVRMLRGETDIYRSNRLPFVWEGCNLW